YAAAAYAAVRSDHLKQLNFDLKVLEEGDDLKIYPLWLKEDYQPLRLPQLDALWHDAFFSQVQNPAFFKPERTPFYDAFLTLPEEVLAVKSATAMADYIRDELADKNSQTKQARLILLGNGAAGKTSLVRCLFDEFVTADETATPRIEIREKEYPDGTLLSVWDFGGQVIMHSSHTFFISAKSSYVIVCNQRANEQPDAWLDMLIPRMEAGKKSTVLIVYSHCDNPDNTFAWSRDNALKDKYQPHFDFVFFSVDFKPKSKPDAAIQKVLTEIESRAKTEAETKMSNHVAEIKQLVDADEQTHYFTVAELKAGLGNAELSPVDLQLAVNYGYLFPEKTDVASDDLDDDFIFISQRHWLTYGLYRLINQTGVMVESTPDDTRQHSVLNDARIKQILRVGASWFISAEGGLSETKGDDATEIKYQKEDVALFKRILVNYQFAMTYHKFHDEILLPLATPLDQPSPRLFNGDYEAVKGSIGGEHLEIRFKVLPKDLFFKLVTFIGQHLKGVDDLWRTGVMLHYFSNAGLDDNTTALLGVENNILTVRTQGEQAKSFLQLLSFNIKILLASYPSIAYQAFETVGGNVMSTDLISAISNNQHGVVDTIMKHIKEKGLMSNITYNVNTAGGDFNNIIGDNGTISTGACQEAIEALEQNDFDEDVTPLIAALNALKDDPADKSLLNKVKDTLAGLTSIHSSLTVLVPALMSLL
ncbi:MAG: hypothetical protein KAG14_04855, partial [Mycoplasmataceae bacterium]|nr:hypothetical protein [Mycoplasmataceae bacterium]